VNEGALVEMIAPLKSYVIIVDPATDKRHTQLMWGIRQPFDKGMGGQIRGYENWF